MPGGRAPARELASPLTLLRELEAAHRALCQAQLGLLQSSPHSIALRDATEALQRLAGELGRPGHFATPGHRTPGGGKVLTIAERS